MRLNLVAEMSTTPEIIDILVKNLTHFFPQEALQIMDSGERYQIGKENVIKSTDKDLRRADLCDGMIDAVGNFWMNINPLIKRYQSNVSEEVTMILGHRDYVNFIPNNLLLAALAQDLMILTRKVSDCNYNGESSYEKRWLFLGIPNEANAHSVKVGAHEIAHLFFDKHYGDKIKKMISFEERLNGRTPNHCHNYINDKRCLMNTPHPVTRITIEELALDFCVQHSEELHKIYCFIDRNRVCRRKQEFS